MGGSDTETWDGCCAQCGDQCSGWTYVYNGAPGAKGQCWLKTGVGDPGNWDYDPNVISGLPASGPSPSPTPPAPGTCQRSTTRTASLTALSGRARTRSRGTGAARSVVTIVLAGPTCTTVLLELRGSAGSRLAWVIPAAGTTTRT